MFPVYFITWTTYGTWLPGDERGWVDGSGSLGGDRLKLPDPVRQQAARSRMRDQQVALSSEQRWVVEQTIGEVVDFYRWHLVAMSVRSNHVHLVVQSDEATPEEVMSKVKAWCSRRLNEHCRGAGAKVPVKWWTRHGSTRYLNDEQSLEGAVRYIVEAQDRKTSRGGVHRKN